MPRKASKKKTDEAEKKGTPEEPMVRILKTAQAEKLSPRGDGLLTYQVGRMDDQILLRISGNESSGRFSREWVAIEALREAFKGLAEGVKSFKGALLLKGAWKGRSSCNGGFGAAALKAEGVFTLDPKKRGMLRLASQDALDAWEQAMLALEVPEDAESVPLHPPKPVPFGGRRKKVEAEEAEEAPEEGEQEEADAAEAKE